MAAALAEDGFHTGLELVQHLHRHESLHRAGETAAVDADSALIAQQMLGGCDGHAHFLMLLVACGDDVLQILPAAAAGLVHEAEEGVEVAIVECGHLLCHTVIVGVDVEGAENGAVAALPAALGQLCKEGLERHIPQHLAAADSGYGAALSRDGGVLVGQVGVVCAGVQNAQRKAGYSGTAVLTRKEPLNVTYDFGDDEHRHEGRVITAEYEDFYLVCCYTPNSQDELRRLPYRMRWEDDLREYLCGLDQTKPVVYCGDLNVAHEEIDLKNPKTNHFNPGFSDEERGKMTELLAAGFVDSFRALWPDRADAYSWWSYRAASRARNVGWRIDYFIVSERLRGHIKKAEIWSEIMGSDHCPVMLELE